MMSRLKKRDEYYKEKKKAKEYWKTNQYKRIEEIVKPENRVTYKEAKDFLPWLVDHTKMMEALPEELEQDVQMSYVRKTIQNDNILKAMKMCKSVHDMQQVMADKHMSDNNLINIYFCQSEH